ncbi:hypothetical protein Sango_0807000 [Sesamum angolense]|uniref:RNase H type-1 domain-containing protein n=1 Tax=Sesamum angolense TaxID=2727404 RepID=A0AAE1X461_9LAMI|nr:hypothetical protein Sango_0807000 [Sesamum angolense]
MEFAIKFDFKASNNKAEYEALALGMKMAQDAGASHLTAYFDSQLIVKQVTGEYEAKDKSMVIGLDDNDWRAPLLRWLEEGHLLKKRWEATKIKTRATRFLIQGDMLYKKSFTHPLLCCLSEREGVHVLGEIYSGCCGSHIGTWALANKALRVGYFWPTMKQDARELVSKCERC